MQCETCQSEIARVEDTHSMLVVLQKVTTNGYSYYQCDSGTEHSGLTYQHFHCSRSEMLAGVKACIHEHYQEEKLIPVSPMQVRLHLTVLKAKLLCKQCNQPLIKQAYRFCLTHATPSNSVPDDSHNELGEWCCSFTCAQQSALKTVDSLV